jgi:uncharacterized protein involved in exopolysaccharide biosynthesis
MTEPPRPPSTPPGMTVALVMMGLMALAGILAGIAVALREDRREVEDRALCIEKTGLPREALRR